MNKRSIGEYFKTIFGTLLVAFVLLIVFLGVLQHNVYQDQSVKKNDDEVIDYYLIGVLLEKNKYLETMEPDNYKINLKLGALYNLTRDFKNSEIEYKKAIQKAPYDNYTPQYRLACLYLRLNRFDDAQALMDNILDQPDKKLIMFKADIYLKLGDKYYNFGEYEDAISRYQKSLSYFKIIKKKKESEYLKNSIASSYVYLADIYMNERRLDDAIDALKNALALVNAPILKYKLGLLLVNENPELAFEYLDDVFKTEPSIINYEKSYKFLSIMAEDAQAEGDEAKAELYKYKIKRLKDYFEGNVLRIEDIAVINPQGKIITNDWRRRYRVNFKLQLKNISKEDMNSLFIEIVFKNNQTVIGDYYKQIFDSHSPLVAGAESPIIAIEIMNELGFNQSQPERITAEISASKSETSYKIHLGTFEIIRQPKKRFENKVLVKIHNIFTHLISKLPPFMF